LLSDEINDLRADLTELKNEEERKVTERKTDFSVGNAALNQANNAAEAHRHRYEELRKLNRGKPPRDIPPVLYLIPLILVGIAEWYVNFSTFSAMFIPVFAIAGTVLVAAVFAWASHLHGAYIKQISEILHPAVEPRHVLDRKLAIVIVTVLLLAAFATVVWLRWLVISRQLGEPVLQNGTFGEPSSTMIWSRVGPTIVLNVLIWGLGTLYSWAVHERVPDLRESYRDFLKANRTVEKLLRPFHNDEKRIRAQCRRLQEAREVDIEEYETLRRKVTSKLSLMRPQKAAV
jgi:hypothetical protein